MLPICFRFVPLVFSGSHLLPVLNKISLYLFLHHLAEPIKLSENELEFILLYALVTKFICRIFAVGEKIS